MDINEDAKQILQQLGSSINSAVEKSRDVAEAIERLREIGYELDLTLKMEIGLRPRSNDEAVDETSLELTDEDLKTLRQMKIRIDEE